MSQEIAPVKKKNRIEILDVIRGFAIFGILIANIQSWSGYKFVPFEVLQTLPNYSLNDTLKYLFMFFIDTKFYTLFSILFGIGFYLQFHKFRDEQKEFMKTYRRRLLWLMFFGMVHAFFWSGDILFIYGSVGLVFVLFRNIEVKKLLVLSIVFYYIWLLYDLFIAIYFPDFMNIKPLAYKTYPDISPQEVTAAFTSGNFWEVLQMNWHNLYWRYLDLIPSGRVTKVLALFLLGYYLMSISYFTKYATSKKLLLIYGILGIGITYISYEIGGSMGSYSHDLNNVLYKLVSATGQIFLALFYISILAILDKIKLFNSIFHHSFVYVGRMSFTNYLMHTVFGFLLFYPFFGGLFGTMGLLQISLLAIALYVIQIIFSTIWQKYFTFGPLEWLWRCLTYKKVFPIRRK
ncbi:MAG: DUF418 domain-containing protein [Sulfurimonas sp.]